MSGNVGLRNACSLAQLQQLKGFEQSVLISTQHCERERLKLSREFVASHQTGTAILGKDTYELWLGLTVRSCHVGHNRIAPVTICNAAGDDSTMTTLTTMMMMTMLLLMVMEMIARRRVGRALRSAPSMGL